jgi:hypothetical protein
MVGLQAVPTQMAACCCPERRIRFTYLTSRKRLQTQIACCFLWISGEWGELITSKTVDWVLLEHTMNVASHVC